MQVVRYSLGQLNIRISAFQGDSLKDDMKKSQPDGY